MIYRSYDLHSDVQRADDIALVPPPEAGEKHVEIEKMKRFNSRITAEGYKIGNHAFTNFIVKE